MFYHIRQMAHPLTSLGREWKLPDASELLDPIRPRPSVNQDLRRQTEYLEQVLTQGITVARVKRTVAAPFITQFWIKLRTRGGKELRRPEEYFVRRWKTPQWDRLLSSSFRIIPPTENQPELLLEFMHNDGGRDVSIREVLESETFQKSTSPLTVPLGLDAAGKPAVTDLAALPHLHVTGITGAGKSVFLKGLILGLIFKHTPEDLRLVILAGMPEMPSFRNLPHLLGPFHYFEEYGREVLNILKWLEAERDARLELMKSAGYEDFELYNRLSDLRYGRILPRIVFIVDHYFTFRFADLQDGVPALKEVDPIFLRLVQTAHPAGIHLVLTNQTPGHKEMSTTLKASLTARVGFAQGMPDFSVQALGTKGAERLCRPGEMMFRKNQSVPFERYQCCNVTGEEALRVAKYWCSQV